jgi:hypothetical protein
MCAFFIQYYTVLIYLNYLEFGQCCAHQPLPSADNIDLGQNNSGYPQCHNS